MNNQMETWIMHPEIKLSKDDAYKILQLAGDLSYATSYHVAKHMKVSRRRANEMLRVLTNQFQVRRAIRSKRGCCIEYKYHLSSENVMKYTKGVFRYGK